MNYTQTLPGQILRKPSFYSLSERLSRDWRSFSLMDSPKCGCMQVYTMSFMLHHVLAFQKSFGTDLCPILVLRSRRGIATVGTALSRTIASGANFFSSRFRVQKVLRQDMVQVQWCGEHGCTKRQQKWRRGQLL